MGHPMKRKEDPRFIRGKGRYVDDITLPGMLYMDIVRSPHAHAKIKKINTDRALKIPGVLAVIDEARRVRRTGGTPTVLFIDEVHRFSKTQQDSLLAAVEDRTVTLLAATTENPYFSVISPLLSRCVLLTLRPLDEDAVRELVRRAVTDERGLAGRVTLAKDAEDHLVTLAGATVARIAS